jgi:hypothetical protein
VTRPVQQTQLFTHEKNNKYANDRLQKYEYVTAVAAARKGIRCPGHKQQYNTFHNFQVSGMDSYWVQRKSLQRQRV